MTTSKPLLSLKYKRKELKGNPNGREQEKKKILLSPETRRVLYESVCSDATTPYPKTDLVPEDVLVSSSSYVWTPLPPPDYKKLTRVRPLPLSIDNLDNEATSVIINTIHSESTFNGDFEEQNLGRTKETDDILIVDEEPLQATNVDHHPKKRTYSNRESQKSTWSYFDKRAKRPPPSSSSVLSMSSSSSSSLSSSLSSSFRATQSSSFKERTSAKPKIHLKPPPKNNSFRNRTILKPSLSNNTVKPPLKNDSRRRDTATPKPTTDTQVKAKSQKRSDIDDEIITIDDDDEEFDKICACIDLTIYN